MLDALNEPEKQKPLRLRAREDVRKYDREAGLAGYDGLIGVPYAEISASKQLDTKKMAASQEE